MFIENKFLFSFPVLVLRVYPIRDLQENNDGLKFAGTASVYVVMELSLFQCVFVFLKIQVFKK